MKYLALLSLFFSVSLTSGAITVTTTNDTGPGSLRDAINQVNASTNDSETIDFNIPGSGVHAIKPATPLPYLTNTVVLNGYSQPGSHPNTLAQGDDAVILIEIDGQLLLGGGGSEVYGLALQAIQLQGFGDIVQGNFIGADPSGTNKIANADGLYLRAPLAHQIGGIHPADRNLISGNSSGISGFGAQPNPLGDPLPPSLIQGNYIGTDRSGTRPLTGSGLGNTGAGISIAATDQIIGGTEPGAGNIIAFNHVGVQVGGRAINQLIEGNSIFANPGGGISGANDGPVITSASPGSTTVKGSITATPGMSYRVEIFANDLCDPSGVGQGKTFLGYGNVTLDPAGQGDFTATVSTPLIAGAILTATATPSLRLEGTSNFSRCLEVEPPLDLALTVSGPPGPVPGSSNAVLNIVVANNSAQAASGVALQAELLSAFNVVSIPAGWQSTSVFPESGPLLNVLTAILPSIAPGARVTNTITITPTVVGTYVSSFRVQGGQPDENQSNNQAQLTLSVFNPAPRQIVVTNAASSGAGSLAQAINDANKGVGGDTITFNIPGPGIHQITNTFLPTVNVPVTIDGYTQPGSKANTLASGDNAVLLIELTQSEILFESGSCTVRGLVVPSLRFLGNSSLVLAAGPNAIEGCFIGTDPTGLHASTNVPPPTGISIEGADDTRIGGSAPAQRNIISAVQGQGVANDGRTGYTPGAITSGAARTVIQGNYIGTDVTGQNPLGNNGSGIVFGSGVKGNGPVNGGLVGGINPGEGNIIAYNNGAGVDVADPRSHLTILGNSIFGNTAIGISEQRLRVTVLDPPLSSGMNGLGAAPTLTDVTQTGSATRVQGYLQALTNETYRLEFFASPSNSNAFIQSEGKTLLGSQTITTDAHGHALFDSNLPASSGLISGTATDSAGATSTFFTFYQAAAASCLEPGDLVTGTVLFNQFGTNGIIVHAVQGRTREGKPLGIYYRRDSSDLTTAQGQPLRDLAFANNALWVVDSPAGSVSRSSSCGEPLGVFFQGTGAPPFSITFNAGGDVYIGLNSTNTNLMKFAPNGQLLDQYALPCDSILGVVGMDLAADQHTLFYGSYSRKIHRYDLATHQPLSDFATNNFGSDYFRILPDGGLVTADQRWLRRYDPQGKPLWTNLVQGQYFWSAVRLDPDQKTFWALDLTPRVLHFDLGTGALLESFAVDVQNLGEYAGGLAILGEPVAALGGTLLPTGPTLNLGRNASQTLLSWSASATGFAVQSSSTIGPTANWQPFGTATLSNGQYTVPVNPTEHTRFFRLLKP
jgi:hypothetical protein